MENLLVQIINFLRFKIKGGAEVGSSDKCWTWNTDWNTDWSTQQTQTVSGLQVALLIVGNFTIKCHAVLGYEGGGEGSASSKCCGWGSNVVAGAGSFITYLLFRYFTREPLTSYNTEAWTAHSLFS